MNPAVHVVFGSGQAGICPARATRRSERPGSRRARERRGALPVHGAVGGLLRGHRIRLRP